MKISNKNIDELLPKVKEIELEILLSIDKFCRENNLKYSIAYGTMIGAIRHKGFIPWDDDIDIFMLREDYDKFISLWHKNHPNGLILENKDTNVEFTQSFTKIRKDNTTFLQPREEKLDYHKGIFIDIFPMDRVPNNKFIREINFINICFYLLMCREFVSKNDGLIMRILTKLLLIIVPKKIRTKVRNSILKRITKYNNNKKNKLYSFDTFGDAKKHYDSNLFDDIIEVEFEKHMFMCFKNYDKFLTKQYGDYMQLPPEEERAWKHHPLLIDLEHNYEEIIQ